MGHQDRIRAIRQYLALGGSADVIDQLYSEWAELVTTVQERLEYCEARLQYLEADLASMDESAFLIHGSQVKGEIAWLKGEIRKQERALQQ